MIPLLRELYRRLDRLQQRIAFRVAASVLVVAACGLVFGALIVTAASLDRQRETLVGALMGQNLVAKDDLAVGLAETGTVTVGGRTYSAPRLADQPGLMFDEAGNFKVAPAVIAEVLLRDQYPPWAPRWLLEHGGTVWMLAIVVTAWLLLIVWMGITVPFVLTLAGTGLGMLATSATGSERAVFSVGGIGLLVFTFVLLTRAVQLLYNRPNQVLAVAHTVIKEASRTKIPLVFIILILGVLPLLPLSLESDAPLRFQIQTFISRSLGLTFYAAACMTLFLSCATVAFEIRDRQIWQLVTKPVSRLNYLLGKWVGVITVNLIILAIASISIFTFIQYLREQPVARGLRGQEDAQQVRDAVLTARLGSKPTYHELDDEQMRARIDEWVLRDAELAVLDEVPLGIRREIAEKVRLAHATGQRNIPSGAGREYLFDGLERARDLETTLTLRYRFQIMRNDEHETFPVLFIFNGDPNLQLSREYVPTMSHVLSVPSQLVREDGTLSIAVVNLFQPPPDMRGYGQMIFEEKDFELLYQVSSFEANFLRAVLMDWIKLAFLAILGISCATFLSFPVACLMSFTIFIAGTIGPFLAQSLEQYYPPMASTMDWTNVGLVIQWAFQSSIRSIAQVIVFLLDAFGEYRPTQALVEGRLIEWRALGQGLLNVGLLWSGLALVIGYVVLRKRQLAIYSGHG